MTTIESGVILVGECLGDFGIKLIESITNGVAVITFFSLPCFAPDSTNCLNWVSIDTLFTAASSKMSAAVESSSSSYSDSYGKMSLCFPFPFA